jgi:deferrochelatase/peroxidase EfeB
MRIDLGDGRPAESGVDVLAPGEILPGYRDANGVVTAAPPLVCDGAYVAVRQLEQDVAGFWKFWRSQAADDEGAVWLAAKAVGRWPNGMPVGGSSPQPPPERHPSVVAGRLSFAADVRGVGCPAGAHIRRANPRDGLTDDPAESLAIAARRRLLRRGRRYGGTADADWYPAAARPAEARPGGGTGPVGLLFIALCADLSRQFEFVQQTWLNNPKFHGLNNEVDPIAAGDGLPDDSRRFSIPREPLRRRVCGLQKWVTVRGGGYFLLPGRHALATLAAGS